MATNKERRWVSLEPRGRVGRRIVERTGLEQWGTVWSQILKAISMEKETDLTLPIPKGS